jgi:gamma-glutamyltranspeptidase/glutathione hydrolase
MIDFTYRPKREWTSFAQRSVAMAKKGMVASSNFLSSLAGYKILARGGNAIDAAVAMVSVQNVVEPHSVGIGGDAFALLYLSKDNKIVGMNASGRSPYRSSIEWFRKRGISAIPERGILSVTVPGALKGWVEAVQTYGRLSLDEVFQDAIDYAENGFPVSEVISGEWSNQKMLLNANESSAKTYLIDGQPPRPGQMFYNSDLANTFKKIVSQGEKVFYEGEICDAIVAFSKKHGGLLEKKDFQDHRVTWVEPVSSNYRGYQIYELPPNGQGITALQILNILENHDLAAMGHNSFEQLHLLAEAKKIAYNDRDFFITDPDFETIPVKDILSKDYAALCSRKISFDKVNEPISYGIFPPNSETVYVTAVDSERNAVSFISSIYMHFGSGMVVDKTGIVLQNRGKSFSLTEGDKNRLEPHKRTLHTIIPAMIFEKGQFLGSFGVMGGDMQPQGHVQLLNNVIDFKMNLQDAVDAPRLRHMQAKQIYLEEGIDCQVGQRLEDVGHQLWQNTTPINQVGGAQAIFLDPEQNVLLAGSDRRKDGCAIGY